jgi:hypothetical protein
MIDELLPGLRVLLPSGNIVLLLRREARKEWICEYTELARARGEVIFTESFLRDWCHRA